MNIVSERLEQAAIVADKYGAVITIKREGIAVTMRRGFFEIAQLVSFHDIELGKINFLLKVIETCNAQLISKELAPIPPGYTVLQ